MNIEAVVKAYNRYSLAYDAIFGLFFSPGRKQVIKNMKLSDGDHVLEVGIGTGASLPLYPECTRITGIDLSPKMLDVTQKRIKNHSIENIEILEMNAENLDFPDNYFSHVIAMYVVSVSPDPKKVIQELNRVCKPGGDIIVLNHFSHSDSFISKVEKFFTPLSTKIGFIPFFPLDDFLNNVSDIEIYDIERTNLFGYWTILRGRKVVS
jgi:phosphatidylethanolamine/phosphatidyl-N-methylethanolamine N-methyltransferase